MTSLIKTALLLCFLVTVIKGMPQVQQPPPEVGTPYDFTWEVNDVESGNVYHHQQSSDGSITRGEYAVLLPDGRRQLVQFYDEGDGYQASVSYDGEPAQSRK